MLCCTCEVNHILLHCSMARERYFLQMRAAAFMLY